MKAEGMEKGRAQDTMEVGLAELGNDLNGQEAVKDKIQAPDSCRQRVVPIHSSPQRVDGEKVYFILFHGR